MAERRQPVRQPRWCVDSYDQDGLSYDISNISSFPFHIRLALVLENLLHPVPLIFYANLLLLYISEKGTAIYVEPTTRNFGWFMMSLFFISSAVTQSGVFKFWERKGPDVRLAVPSFITIFPLFLAVIFHIVVIPAFIILAGWYLLMLMSILTFVRVVLCWKLSAHLSVSALIFASFSMLKKEYMLLYLLLIPIFWTRVALKRHTFNQLVAGFVCGSLIPIVSLKIMARIGYFHGLIGTVFPEMVF